MITEKDLENLPEPVKKWLISTGVLGKKRIKSVSLSQNGKRRFENESFLINTNSPC